ncbi:unnamed protein product, partial [Musa acuminata subsp. burmannicoides]
GCDGCIRLDDTSTFMGEKTAKANKNSVRGFDVIDRIKAAVDSACNRSAVSCTDVLAVAARDSVAAARPSYQVQLGRRDSRTASKSDATSNNPASKWLPANELVVLSGAHTLGPARCTSFRSRL